MNNDRYFNPADINVPVGYQIDVYITGLDAPNSIVFDNNGDLIISESGYFSGEPRIFRYHTGEFQVISSDFIAPVTGMNMINRNLYVSNSSHISVVEPDGSKYEIISGMPSTGDYGCSKVVLGNDRKIYWGLGTATNSGVVGTDNPWIYNCSQLCDSPGTYIILNGQNFETQNVLVRSEETTLTGAFSPFGVPNQPYEVRKSFVKANGSILKANLDGTAMELVAWGLRFPPSVRFDHNFRLFATNQGYDDRGSRPIVNAPDEFLLIQPDTWYGWPDFAGGEPVTLSRFRPEGGKQPEFLLTNHPSIPQIPFATFPAHSGVMGFDFNYNTSFGDYGDAYIAEHGDICITMDGTPTPYAGFGHRVSRLDISNGSVTTFAINKSGYPSSISGEGGFGHPIDLCFGPDGVMYILDIGLYLSHPPFSYIPNTGAVWRITRVSGNL